VNQTRLVSESELEVQCSPSARIISVQQDKWSCVVPRSLHVTVASVSLVRVYGTAYHRPSDRASAANCWNDYWEHFCLGVGWPQRIV